MVNMPNVGSACLIQVANGVLMLTMKVSVTSVVNLGGAELNTYTNPLVNTILETLC